MKLINHIEPVAPRQARGLVADVYAEARHDFGRLPEPVIMLSPHEGLLAASWATLRETLIAGHAPRERKEAVAAAVAAALRCPFCVDAHTVMLYAAGDRATAEAILADEKPADEAAPYVAWARGTSAPHGPPPPFVPELTAEYVGTAIQFHFIARLVLVLLDETFLSGGPRAQSLLRRAAGRAFSRKVRGTYQPGLATERLSQCALPEEFAWAAPSPSIACAFAAMTDCLETAQHLPEPGRDVVRRALREWHGEAQPISSSWTSEYTDGLPDELRAPTRLALLTSLAAHQVTDADIVAARQLLTTDTALVAALAWAAWSAARRISGWITRPVGTESAPSST